MILYASPTHRKTQLLIVKFHKEIVKGSIACAKRIGENGQPCLVERAVKGLEL